MNPKAVTRRSKNAGTETNRNPSLNAGNRPTQGNSVIFFDTTTTYNGETFNAGDVLFGDNTASTDNLVYKSGALQARTETLDTVTMGSTGLRVVRGGLSLKQSTEASTLNGNVELDENGAAFTTSHYYIANASGAFTIDSLAAPDNEGLELFLVNGTAQNMTLTNDFGSPTSGFWTIHTFTGASVSTTGDGIAHLIGDETNNRWNLISIRG